MLASMDSEELTMWQAYYRALDNERETEKKQGEKEKDAQGRAKKRAER